MAATDIFTLFLPAALFFFFNDTATTEIYPLSLHDALPISLGAWISTGPRTIVFIDDVPVILDERDAIEGVFLLKEVPDSVRTLSSVRLRARYRSAVGLIPASVPLNGGRRSWTLVALPYFIHNAGRILYISTSPTPGKPAPPPLADLIDTDSVTVSDKSAKELRLTFQSVQSRALQYQYAADRDLTEEGMTLKYNLLDIVDREVEFEIKDVKLRD